ncbi:MAG: hypothetical protein M5U29_05095 [Anaerolineae bacterium]|nr:hypothetical protein [Anaerolineae bacterium]
MIANLIAALVLTTIAVCFGLILVGLAKSRETERPTHSRRVLVKAKDETDWWDQEVDDTGWTNGDFICAAELEDEWGGTVPGLWDAFMAPSKNKR